MTTVHSIRGVRDCFYLKKRSEILMRHTGGSWKIDTSGLGYIQILTGDGKHLIGMATTSGAGVKHKSPTSKANARLMAAAPEMYEALKSVQQLLVLDLMLNKGECVADLINKIIAKIESQA